MIEAPVRGLYPKNFTRNISAGNGMRGVDKDADPCSSIDVGVEASTGPQLSTRSAYGLDVDYKRKFYPKSGKIRSPPVRFPEMARQGKVTNSALTTSQSVNLSKNDIFMK
jgi:hypothetical protein